MARNQETTENTEAQTAETEAAPVEAKKDSRYVELKLADGSTMKRKDYILKRWGEKASRSDIAKELTQLEGREVPYQIVFQATKGVPGGPDKAAPAVAEAPAETETVVSE